MTALLSSFPGAASPAFAFDYQSSTRAAVIVQPVDETQRVVLFRNTRGEARPEFDRGPVDDSLPMNGMQLQLKMTPERAQAAAALADELQKGDSPRFHQWLTAEEYGAAFGAAPEDIAQISAWLTFHGFTVDDPGPSRMIIRFSGTAGQVREAFDTEIHALEVEGKRHIANMRDPSIPAALAPAIEGIVSLHDFRPKPLLVPKSQYTYPLDGFLVTAVVPADLATIYNFNPIYSAGITGKGQTIAVIEDTDIYTVTDWTTFRSTFGLSKYKDGSLTTVHPGHCPDPGVNEDEGEAILDAEWASAAAPSARIEECTCANTTTTFGGLIAIQNLVNQKQVPQIMSVSYGECEPQDGAAANAAYKAAYLQGVLEGLSIFVAAGDFGAAGCDYFDAVATNGIAVNGIASTVYNVAVGGTDFGDGYAGTTANYWSTNNSATYGSALSYVPEIPWNDSCASELIASYLGYPTTYGSNGFCASAYAAEYFYSTVAGSGGASDCATGTSTNGIDDGTCQGWKKPAWQDVLGNPDDGVRDLPDVSVFAGNGVWNHYYVLCDSDVAYGDLGCVGAPSTWNGSGGTSVSSPIMAGLQALVNQKWGGGPQGNPAPYYYALARIQYGRKGNPSSDSFAEGGPAATAIFHDVTLGDNDVDCTGPNNCYDSGGSSNVVGVLSLSDKSYKPAYTAGTGWNFATGIGTPNAANLVFHPIWQTGWGQYWDQGWGPR